MSLPSSETQPCSRSVSDWCDGPVLECAMPGVDPPSQSLVIRARRMYRVSRDELFSAWTRRSALDTWMRLRARSRASLTPQRGGAFRLELAEGATIHVITGMVNDLRPGELLSLLWSHHTTSEQPSIVDVAFRSRQGMSELSIVHHSIASRREAAWLMGLWTGVLERLSTYLDDRPAVEFTLGARVPAARDTPRLTGTASSRSRSASAIAPLHRRP